MRHNKKWFKKIAIPLPEIFSLTTAVSESMATSFFSVLKNNHVHETTMCFFYTRYCMSPEVRLAVNLKVLLDQFIQKRRVDSTIPDGISDNEHDCLEDIETKDIDPITKMVAHSLLNVEERNAILPILKPLFVEIRISNKETEDGDNDK
jgi:hypothetical protein